tara:strand:+ start:212 stop:469 length:258 start_codon:yes stop_codon:yes gene_type:complete
MEIILKKTIRVSICPVSVHNKGKKVKILKHKKKDMDKFMNFLTDKNKSTYKTDMDKSTYKSTYKKDMDKFMNFSLKEKGGYKDKR